MKRVIVFLVVSALVGGVSFGLYRAGLLPYGKKSGTKRQQTVAKADPANLAVHGGPETTAMAAPAPRKPAPQPARPEDPREAERRIRRMAAVYDGMPADAVAPILEKLPHALVRDLLRHMDDGQVGKVLLAMKPDRAALLTRELIATPAPLARAR